MRTKSPVPPPTTVSTSDKATPVVPISSTRSRFESVPTTVSMALTEKVKFGLSSVSTSPVAVVPMMDSTADTAIGAVPSTVRLSAPAVPTTVSMAEVTMRLRAEQAHRLVADAAEDGFDQRGVDRAGAEEAQHFRAAGGAGDGFHRG